jgi:hypothetical protein
MEAYRDFRTVNNGIANAAVFEEWFLSERCREQDKRLIQVMLADDNGLVFGDEQTSKTISAEFIAAIGAMPFGKNYLAIHAATIMNDPIFTEVRDRSNANFLWFIKFEKSFKEAEKHADKDFDLSTGDKGHEIIYSARPSQDQAYDQSASAEIIHFQPNTGNGELSGQHFAAGKPGKRKIAGKRRHKHKFPPGTSAEIINLYH